jgi:hypothetical protein
MSISKQKSYMSARNRDVNVQDPEWRDERAAPIHDIKFPCVKSCVVPLQLTE